MDVSDVVATFDGAAGLYDGEGVRFFTPLGCRLVQLAGLTAGWRVLDVATGRGACLFPAAEAVGLSGAALGTDLAPGMVSATACEAADRGLDHVRVELGDAMAPAVDAPVDAVLCGLGLFFLPDPAAALAAWRRLLAPGGRVAVSVFTSDDPLWAAGMTMLADVAGTAAGLGAPLDTRPPGAAILAPGALDTALADLGLTPVADERTTQDVVFDDVAHWWRWSLGHGHRRLLSLVPRDRADSTRDRLTELLAAAHGDSGLHWRPTIRLLVAGAG